MPNYWLPYGRRFVRYVRFVRSACSPKPGVGGSDYAPRMALPKNPQTRFFESMAPGIPQSMCKPRNFIIITLGLALLVQGLVLFRLWEENKTMLQRLRQTEDTRSELEEELRKATNYQITAEALDLEVTS